MVIYAANFEDFRNLTGKLTGKKFHVTQGGLVVQAVLHDTVSQITYTVLVNYSSSPDAKISPADDYFTDSTEVTGITL